LKKEAKMISKLNIDAVEKAKKYSPLVEELSGVIKIDKDFDFRKEYTDYLIEKYR
jgi:hypothetical protein